MTSAGLLGRILPARVVAVEGLDGPLWPEEEPLVANAVPRRRQEVAAGRACARRALELLGAPVGALPADADRLPRWPDGVAGSITHTAGYVAAAVAWQRDHRAIGIDAEELMRVDEDVEVVIATPDEQRWLAGEPLRRALLFSAKEAAFKCQFAITREMRDFLDASLEVPALAPEGVFRVSFHAGAARALSPIAGRFVVGDTHVATIATL